MAHILIVDDDPELGWLLEAIVQLAGHTTVVATNGAEGFVRLSEVRPDLVLLDVEMPILSGPGMVQQMLLTNCGREKIPVVLLSGVADLPNLAAQLGTPYFLEKPVSAERLQHLINRVLVERRPPRPSFGVRRFA